MDKDLLNAGTITGLSDKAILQSRKEHGSNKLMYKKENRLVSILKSLAGEPMVILLLAAAIIYFVNGDKGDGIFLACSIILVAGISLYQDSRSQLALDKLKDLSQPACRVIRNGNIITIPTEELVVNDCLLAEEGNAIAADGIIIHASDFCVNESIITGESMPVCKTKTGSDTSVYMGTIVTSGLAIIGITAVGNATKLGQTGKSLENITTEKTPLEQQINSFVRLMVIIGIIVFIVVWILNFIRSYNLLDSLLKSLALAMSILPEEIPVAFTTFMALGAWRLMRMGIIVKQMKTVETLGSATVICTDKTGTLTENKMAIAGIYTTTANTIINEDFSKLNTNEQRLIELAMWASEPVAFDPMEIALHNAYSAIIDHDERPFYQLFREYPLEGHPPMMTHVFRNQEGHTIIAAKGAPEAIIDACRLTGTEETSIATAVTHFTRQGYRVLGVAETLAEGNIFPQQQRQLNFSFAGIVAFYDPPKRNISTVLQQFYNAGMQVKIITGDNADTTIAIAKQIGFRDYNKSISGQEIMQLNGQALLDKVTGTMIFTRMFPEAKLKVINSLKACHAIVAMIGDGVNDGPALKAAHIGIAMGKKGTEIARQAASLVLAEDDLSKMADAIAMGRRIYTNLKKAIQYIISIHIPIVLTVLIPLAAGWLYPNIFTPVHIIFMELIMGPTCSVIYENEPMEKNTMSKPPRPFTSTFFHWKELMISIVQGLAITGVNLLVYQFAVRTGYSEATTRSMVFLTLISANIFLTLVNRSFYYSVITTLHYYNKLVPLIITITIVITAALLYIPPLSSFFKFKTLSIAQTLISIIAGFAGVIWIEAVKWRNRKQLHQPAFFDNH